MSAAPDKPVLLRVKRRRGEESSDFLYLDVDASHPTRKRLNRDAAGEAGSLELGMGALSADAAPSSRGGGEAQTAGAAAAASSTSLTQHSVRFRRVDTVPLDPREMRAKARLLLRRLVPVKHLDATKQQAAATNAAAHQSQQHRADAVAKKRGAARSESGHTDRQDPLRSMFRVYELVAPSQGGAAAGAASGRSSSAGPPSAVSTAAAAGPVGGGTRLVRRRAGLRDPRSLDYRLKFVPQWQLAPKRIMAPFQRLMDEGIFRAFQSGDFSGVYAGMRDGVDVNFQRFQSDLSTALMAAAYCGEEKAALHLLSRGALVRIPNLFGHTALRIALDRGYSSLAALLGDVLQEEEEELAAWQRASATFASGSAATPAPAGDNASGSAAAVGTGGGSGTGGDAAHPVAAEEQYDFDVYIVDGASGDSASASSSSASHQGGMHVDVSGSFVDAVAEFGSAPEWKLRSAEEALAEGNGEEELVYTSDSEGDSEDSEDSNAENHPDNDYPEEEEDSDEGGGIYQRQDDSDGDASEDGEHPFRSAVSAAEDAS